MPRAPLKHGNAGGTSTAAGCDAPPNARRGARLQCQAPAPRAMWACCADSSSDDDDHNTSNTLFADAFVYLRSSMRWTSSWWPYLVVSLWTFSPLRNKTDLDLNPIFWLMILDATSGSEVRPRLGLKATARVDVHLCRLPHLAFGFLEGSPSV